MKQSVDIDATLVKELILSQFPEFSNLPVVPVKQSGWDNRTFHLGEAMLVRLPSGEHYAKAVAKEQRWLPWLAPKLPLPIPKPIARGQPDCGFEWEWSIYQWIDGEVASHQTLSHLNQFAQDLAGFLLALQSLETTNGPTRKLRGGSLALYAAQMDEAFDLLSGKLDVMLARDIWDQALREPLSDKPVWYHGDIAAGNLLVIDGQLSAVIDFGGLGVGDPACDLVIAWTFLDSASRKIFKRALGVSEPIWNRARGWALWKAMIVVAGIIETNAIEAASSQYALDQVFEDYQAS